jgi:thiamine biosynthesis protein ThiI
MADERVCVALVSGGIDSPVAVARMARAGWRIVPLHCSQEPITGPEAQEKTRACLAALRGGEGPLGEAGERIDQNMRVAPVGATLAEFTDPAAHRDYFVHMKRLFNAIGCRLAEQVGATALLTGENLGQVSSQTLGNLGAVEEASSLRIMRPLLGLDKQQIIDEARVLGTFDVSAGPEVCDALGPNHPTTVADLPRLRQNEADRGGLPALADACFAGITEQLI